MKYLIILFLIPLLSYSQLRVQGVVKDSQTEKALPFASIKIGDSTKLADIDGRFSIDISENEILTISYTGYKTSAFAPDAKTTFYPIYLQPRTEIKSPDDALTIIKIVARKTHNDPKRKLSSFDFKAHRKLIVTADPSEISTEIDTIIEKPLFGKRRLKLDSTSYKFQRFVSKQHLFATEKVSHYQYDSDNFKETIIGAKMAGFPEPVYEMVGFNLQPLSIYEPTYELFGTIYRNPISRHHTENYRYKILDTISINGRDSYAIHFKNVQRNRKNRLEGVIFIDRQNYAIAKAVFRVRSILSITATHEFEYQNQDDLYFPSKLTFKMSKGQKNDNLKLFGETIFFDPESEQTSVTKRRMPSDETYVLSETKISDVRLNQPVKIKKRYIAIEIKDSAIRRDSVFWQRYSEVSDPRESNTYRTLDSIVLRKNIAGKLRFGRKIINGYVPFGPFDFDLRYVLSYNNYEGFRIGIGGVTNDKLSEKYRIDSYTAYGTKDGEFKYSIGASARIGKFSDTWIGYSFTDDVKEIASTTFLIDPGIFKIYDPRPINISTFYNHMTNRAFIRSKIIPKTESLWQLSNSKIDPLFNYGYNPDDRLHRTFTLTMAVVSLQWNPFSDYMQTPKGRIETAKRFPKFTFQYSHTLPEILDNKFIFGKIDFRTEYEKKYHNGQKSALLLEAGYAYGDVPLTHLYNSSPNNLNKDRLLQRITFSGKNSFETMYFNEFFSNKYVIVQFKHGLKRINISGMIKPSPVLVTRMAYGSMDNRQDHLGLDFKTLEKGYFESGIELNRIFSGLGLSGFYRYGPNQLSQLEDNIAVKLNFVLDLGF